MGSRLEKNPCGHIWGRERRKTKFHTLLYSTSDPKGKKEEEDKKEKKEKEDGSSRRELSFRTSSPAVSPF